MKDRRNKAGGDTPYRPLRTDEARRDYAPAGRVARGRRGRIATAVTVVTVAARMIMTKTTAAARNVTMAAARTAATAAATAARMILTKKAVAVRSLTMTAARTAATATATAAQMILTKKAVAVRNLAMAAAICITFSLAGCRSVDVMDMADVPVRHWHHGVELKVTPPSTDTLYDLDLLVRYNHNFTVDTLTLWFRTRSNDTLIYTERCRFELPMSQRPAAVRPVVSLPWRCGVRFSAQEPYRIRITPLQPVRGIEAVGIRLRPVTTTQ